MKSCEGQLGRVFVIRLEDGDVLPDCIERFAENQGVSVGHVIIVGGIKEGIIVVGPRNSDEMPPKPVLFPIDEVHEISGVGVIAPDKDGRPNLHIHAALGRAGTTVSGCLRHGVTTWLVCEVIFYEIIGAKVARIKDKNSNFDLLQPGISPNNSIDAFKSIRKDLI